MGNWIVSRISAVLSFALCWSHRASFTHRQNFSVGGSAFFIDNKEVIVKSDFWVVNNNSLNERAEKSLPFWHGSFVQEGCKVLNVVKKLF